MSGVSSPNEDARLAPYRRILQDEEQWNRS